jgi:hypothetical protein
MDFPIQIACPHGFSKDTLFQGQIIIGCPFLGFIVHLSEIPTPANRGDGQMPDDPQGKSAAPILNIPGRIAFGSLLPSIVAPLVFVPWTVLYAYLTGETRPIQDVLSDFLLPLVLLGPILYIPACFASVAITILPSLRRGRSKSLFFIQGLTLSIVTLHIVSHLFSQNLKESAEKHDTVKGHVSDHASLDMVEYSLDLSVNSSSVGRAVDLTAQPGYHQTGIVNLLNGSGLPSHAVFLSADQTAFGRTVTNDNLMPDFFLRVKEANDGLLVYDFKDTDLAWWQTRLPKHWAHEFKNAIPVPIKHDGSYFHFYCRIDNRYGKGRAIRHFEEDTGTIRLLGTVLMSTNIIPKVGTD